jgi:hypothetical protein
VIVPLVMFDGVVLYTVESLMLQLAMMHQPHFLPNPMLHGTRDTDSQSHGLNLFLLLCSDG